ncbi:pentatricopeptide repeat-containing protein At1g08070, chloroplastic-like [Punica granatum]|uniref:Pentatricopeptide repeat-containing protein At1g08070, chloroplastic-like n=1 Tax=Punica granatum TaxID=22663 RepID=A0A6P8DQZ5_PUNGR|nr:pentatricopeptide repeat-containing protein At1g08070, chloroplastic-like [Punica granatum]
MSCCFNRSVILIKMNFQIPSHHLSASVPALAVPQASDTVSLQSSILAVLESCKSPSEIKQVHALVVKTPPLQTQLVYNAIIQGLSSSLEAVAIYREMLLKGLFPNDYTLPFVLKACAQARALSEVEQVHAHAVKSGLLASNVYVSNTLMRAYAVCGLMSDVRKLFEGSPRRDVVSWTTLIQAYVKMGLQKEGVGAFFKMCEAGFAADERTLVIVLSACAKLGDLSLGRRLQAYIQENGVKRDVFVGNALVDMFLKCGDAALAHQVFKDMPVKNVVSWNSVILGLAQQGNFKEALRVFKEMQRVGVRPDDVTLVGVLNSCANLGLLDSGKWVHAYIDKHDIRADGFIGNALIDMYSKCGSIGQALNVFQGMKLRDVYSYTAIIVGLAMHGEAKWALDIFSDMSETGIEPDQVTFVGVLSACSHAGLVEEGRRHFENMSSVYGLEPQPEHYGCLVDLLGRAGLFAEAEEIIRRMPMEPDAFVWGALLGACRIYGKVELGERAMKRLLEIEPEREGAYILMSNMYSSEGKWKDAIRIRKSMKERYMKKVPGCSSIELDGKVHEFRKGDKSHPKMKEIWKFLENLASHLKSYGQEDI